MERWTRQNQVYNLLQNEWYSVKDLADKLEIGIQLADALFYRYRKNGHLKRKKIFNRYYYMLTEKGFKHLKDFLESGKYLEYLELHQEQQILN